MIDKLTDEDLTNHNFQKEHWQEFLEQYDEIDSDDFGFEWGDPDDEKDRHGHYKAVKALLLQSFSKESVVLEIGSLGGKWTQYLLSAKKVIAVDINDYFVDYLTRKFYKSNNLEFYVSGGNELNGIEDNSVDMVFSMDTFSRVQKKYIWDYFREIGRILTDRGGLYYIYQMMTCQSQKTEALHH